MSAKIIPFRKPPVADDLDYELVDLNTTLIANPRALARFIRRLEA